MESDGDDSNNNDEIDSQRPLVALAMRTNRGCFQRYIAKLHRCAFSLLVHDVSTSEAASDEYPSMHTKD